MMVRANEERTRIVNVAQDSPRLECWCVDSDPDRRHVGGSERVRPDVMAAEAEEHRSVEGHDIERGEPTNLTQPRVGQSCTWTRGRVVLAR